MNPEINNKEDQADLSNIELKSINRGLRDFEQGKVHSTETARKLYEKYLEYLPETR